MSSRGRSRGQNRGRSRGRGQDHDGWEEWGGYMEAKRQKLREQFSSETLTPAGLSRESSIPGIFSGVTIHVNGYTEPSSDELKRFVVSGGGHYEHPLYRTRVTHVVATNLTDSKVKNLKGLRVVRPEWITDSVKCGKLLSYTDYQLYTAKSGRQLGLSGFAKQTSTESAPSSSYHDDDLDDILGIGDLEKSHSTEGSDSLNNQSCHGNTTEHSNVNLTTTTSDAPNISRSNSDISKSASNASKHHLTAKAGNPKFLDEFYTNSRLHHLSTWKAELRQYVNELQSKGDDLPGKEKLRNIVQQREINGISQDSEEFKPSKGRPDRCVMHIDMDCFFVSVGLRKRPHLKGKPVAVTHSKGKGATPTPGSDLDFERKQWELRGHIGDRKKPENKEGEDNMKFPDQSDGDGDIAMETSEPFHSMASIASCSYEARKAGVKNGMLMGKAMSFCPALVSIPYDFEGYNEVSKILYDTVASYTHDIEAVSCDEMLVDCTDLLASTGASPLEFASVLRQEVRDKTGCDASAGLASNILLARMATRRAKPNGQFHLEAGSVVGFICPQPIRDIPGVGWSLAKKFDSMNIATCGDLQKVTMETLQKQFGQKNGQTMYRYCRGRDDRPIKMEHRRKSVSAEVNYGIRFTCESEAIKFVEELAEEACSRLINIGMKGRSVTLKLMIRRNDAPKETAKFMGHGICTHVSKSAMLPLATDESRIVGKECVTILRQQNSPVEDLRGIGIQIQKLEPAKVGPKSNLPKNQSILNFAVTKTPISPAANYTDTHCIDNGDNFTRINTLSTPAASINSRTSIGQSDSFIPGTDQLHVDVDSTSDQSEFVLHTDQSKSASVPGQSASVLHINQSDGTLNNTQIDQSVRDLEPDKSKQTSFERRTVGNFCDMDKAQEQYSGNKNLLEDVSRRQTDTVTLPPLPQWLDIRTPDSDRVQSGPSHTPEGTTPDSTADSANVDYFPSPSQVDPEVLKELPPDIREQVEKEMKSRQRKESSMKRQPRSSVGSSDWPDGETGCGSSHWSNGDSSRIRSETKGDDSNRREDKSKDQIVPFPSPSQFQSLKKSVHPARAPDKVDPEVLKELPPDIREQVEKEMKSRQQKQSSTKRQPRFSVGSSDWPDGETGCGSSHWSNGDSSRIRSEKKGDDSNRREDKSKDQIVPLPSPSQLDASCLEALPESMQNEIREAYAKRDSAVKESHSKGGNPLILQQAGSPSKSPRKKSPVKTRKSPNFKVPRGKPATGGRKKSSSKKLVFKDQPLIGTKITAPAMSTPVTSSDVIVIQDTQPLPAMSSASTPSYKVTPSCSTRESNDTQSESSSSLGIAGVSLCGAVTLSDVRSLIKEWIFSTVSPLQEDEAVLIDYLQNLVLDKNLEQVDLVLKFLHRNVQRVEKADWMLSVQRIFTETQYIVKSMYGSKLASI